MIILIDIDNNDNDAHQDRQPVASRTRFYRINRKWSQVDFKYFSNIFQIFFNFSNIFLTRVSAAFGRQNPSWIVEW